MNEEILKNIWNQLTSDEMTKSDFETWKKNVSSSEDVQRNIHGYLSDIELTSSDFETWKTNLGLKKKEDSTLETEATDGEPTPTSLDSSEKKKYSDFLDLDEEFAKPQLIEQLRSKGFSVDETGIGDALLVTDNVTGEKTEIDLQKGVDVYDGGPEGGQVLFTIGGDQEKEMIKLKGLLEKPVTPKSSLFSGNLLADYEASAKDGSPRFSYINQLRERYSDLGFDFETLETGHLKIKKGDNETVVNIKPGYVDSNQFSNINKFLFENITDDEASALDETSRAKSYELVKKIETDIKNEVDLSEESVMNDAYNNNYFSNLFDYLDSMNIDTSSIPKEVIDELKRSQKQTGVNPRTGAARTIPYDPTDIQNALDTYFSDVNLGNEVDEYNKKLKGEVRDNLIDRATKLKMENIYKDMPNREQVTADIRKELGELDDEEVEISSNVKMATDHYKNLFDSVKADIKKLAEDNPGVSFNISEVDGQYFIESTDKSVNLQPVQDKLANGIINYYGELAKYEKDLERINAKKDDVKLFKDASKRNYNLVDIAIEDFKSAADNMAQSFIILGGLATGSEKDVEGARAKMAQNREKLEKYYETKRTYTEAYQEGSSGRFATRTFMEQAPNIALAIGTSGAGLSLGMTEAGVSTLVGTLFGLTSSGQKYDDLTTRQEIAADAQKTLNELNEVKDLMGDREYLESKYQLERAIKENDISSTDKTLAVLGTGLIEGTITKFFGTVPNSIKVLKDLRAPSTLIDDLMRSNYKAAGQFFKEIGKRTGGEIIEETSIEALTQVNDFAFIGDEMDFSQLDDVAVTSIITSGGMNVPGTAYSTLMSQINVNRYKSKIQGITGEIQTMKDLLNDKDLTDIQRTAVHNKINALVGNVADVTTAMEGDALLLGSDNLKELLTLSGVKKGILNKAGIKPEDSQEIANEKLKNYYLKIDKKEAEKLERNLKYIQDRQNEIVGGLNYDNAIARVFGDKGVEIEKTLDPSLTPQQKYKEVYKQIRQEINDNAVKEFQDAIQKQETRDIPDAQPAEGVQEVEEEVRVTPEEEAEVEAKQEAEESPLRIYRMDKSSPSKWKKDFEIIDNRDGAEGLDIDGKSGNWYVRNRITGDMVAATSKKDAQDIVKNAPSYSDLFGDGTEVDMRDIDQKDAPFATFEKIQEEVEIKTEPATVEGAPDGTYLNVGMIEGKDGKELTEEEIESALPDGVEVLEKTRLEKGENVDEPTLSIKTSRPLTDAEMKAFRETTGQLAIPQIVDGVGTMFGTTDWGPFNAEFFVMPDKAKLSDVAKPSTEGVSKLRDAFGRKAEGAMRVNTLNQKLAIEQQAEKAKQAIAKKYPNMKIEVFYNEGDYHNAIGEVDQSKGTYFNNKVYINLTRATETTVAHEVFHGILYSELKNNAQVQALMKRFVDSLSRSQDPALVAVFAEEVAKVERYKDVQNEEIMAELFGTLAGESLRLKPETKSLIKRFLDKLAKLLGLKKFTDAEVIDVLNTLAGKIATGQEITESEVNIFGPSGILNTDVVKRKSIVGDVNIRRFPTNPNTTLNENVDISNFSGKRVSLMESDRMTGGYIVDTEGNPMYKFFGGVYFPVITGKMWASRKLSTANSIAKNMNLNRDSDGYVYASPIIMKPNSHMSNQDMFETVWEFMKFDLRSPSTRVTRAKFFDYITKALSVKGVEMTPKDLGINKSDNIEVISDKMTRYMVGDDKKLTFDQRKSIIKSLLGDPKVRDSRRFPSAGSISEVALKFEEEAVKDVKKLWDIVMIARTKGNLTAKITDETDEFYHRSYPAEISSDAPIEVFFLDGAYNISDVLPELTKSNGETFSWKDYSERHPSTNFALSQYGRTAKLSRAAGILIDATKKKQVSGRPSIDEIRQYAKENKISDADVRTFLKEVGYTEDQIKVAMKKAPSVKKILGKKPIKKTVDTYAALKDQIRLESRAAREAQKDLNTKRKELASMIKDLAGKGVITANQSTVLINRVSSVNLNNERSVEKLVEYMDKVYQNAEYADNILRSNKGRKRAKKNIRSKIGSANVVFNTLNKLFSIDAKLIPQDVLDTYNDLVNQFGESRAVLNLEDVSIINEKANSILEAIDNEISEIPKLQLLFEGLNKISVKGKEDFSATIAQALSDGEITQQDHDLMKKYKKDIVPAVDKVEVEAEPITFEFKDNNIEDSMENEGAERLIELLKNKKAVDQLSDDLKKNIQAVIDNIDAGFFPSYANNIANEIESIIAKDNVVPRIKKGKYVFDRVAAKVKNFFSSKRSTAEYQIRQNPLSDIDNVLGNMNRTDIYDNIFGKAAKSYANLDAQIDIIHEKIAEADALLFKQFKRNGNKVTDSKFRIMAYMLEREFQSNKDSNKVFSAKDAIKAAIESQKKGETTIYSKKDIEILKSILKEFDGDVNLDSVFNKFSEKEKKAISIIDDVNKSIADKALYTASVIRGARPNMIENYVHHSVASSNENTVESITSKYNQFKTFSTKAGTLVERTPGVKALNFDVLNSTLKGAKETLTDYHMTDTARVIFKTLNKIQADILADENSTDRQIETANALKNAFDTAMRQVFEMNYVNNGMNFLGKAKGLGYKALLASVPRAGAEMSSNFAYVISTSPKSWTVGAKYTEYTLDQRGRDIMINLNSEQTGKLYSKKVTGKTADVGLFVDSEGATPTGAVNGLQNKANQILSYLSKITIKPTEKIAESLISTPDRAISRPLWFGSLDTKFKEITGKKIDMEAIRNGDKNYLKENKEALKEATRFADKEVTRAATSINVFNGVLKNKIDPNDSSTLKIVKEINGFMTNFIIYEYTTARSAISALINSGQISRQKGASLLLGTTARMSLYMVLYQSFSHLFDSVVSAIAGADIGDEEMPEEDLLARQLVGSVVSLIVGKNLGNFAKIVPNMALEVVNEKYLDNLRKGDEYDPYKHSIAFSMLSREDLKKIETGQSGVGDVLLKAFSGPYSPMVKTLTRAIKLGSKVTSEKSKDTTKQKAIEELTTRIVIEMLGNMGMMPFYKDVRRIVIKEFFNREPKKNIIRRGF